MHWTFEGCGSHPIELRWPAPQKDGDAGVVAGASQYTPSNVAGCYIVACHCVSRTNVHVDDLAG